MEITIDLKDTPKGYSAAVQLQNKDFCISLGSGNSLKTGGMKMANVDVNIDKNFRLNISGGESLRNRVDQLMKNPPQDINRAVKRMAIGVLADHIHDNANYLQSIIRRVQEESYKEGVSDTKRNLREFIMGDAA